MTAQEHECTSPISNINVCPVCGDFYYDFSEDEGV